MDIKETARKYIDDLGSEGARRHALDMWYNSEDEEDMDFYYSVYEEIK